MFVQGMGKSGSKKNNDKFDNALVESEKLLGQILGSKDAKEKYNTINTNTLNSIFLDKDPEFGLLRQEVENYNEEVKKALDSKTEIPNYTWKYNLHIGLRNLLKEIVSTEDKNLKQIFIDKAKIWYYDKLMKKGELDETKLASRPGTNQSSLRPVTAATRPFTANTRPFTSQTNRISEFNNSVNISVIPPDHDDMKEKSYFDISKEDIVPSRLKADILRDYEDGARSKHDMVEPPYERLSEYERKLPQGILKPSSRVGMRPATSKTTTFANNQNSDFKLFGDRDPSKPLFGDANEEGLSQLEGSQAGEGEEGETDGEPAPPKGPGIVVPKRKNFMSDKISGYEQTTKDMSIPMESRSNYSHYVPTNSIDELELENRWRNAMHKKTQERREKQEFRTMMQQWSHTKSRLEEEINRKNESNSFGSRFYQRKFVPRAKSATTTLGFSKRFENGNPGNPAVEEENEEDPDIMEEEEEISERDDENEEGDDIEEQKIKLYREIGVKKAGPLETLDYTKTRPKSVATGQLVPIATHNPLEAKMTQDKIDRIKKLHADLVFHNRGVTTDVGTDGAYNVDRVPSLSIYDQGQAPKYRPFSAVIHGAKPENFRKDQMAEIEEIKAKLAKFKIKVPVKQLKTSLLLPEVNKVQLPKFPEPGQGLMKNPFFKEKKGKKKGGKKKGKK